MIFTSQYYQYIVKLIIEKYKTEFSEAGKGHCIKITGLGKEQVYPLLTRIRADFKNLDSFILSDKINGDDIHVSPSKLINYRNNEEKPLLVLIPANNRTAAEDSYGNTTFKDISLIGIDDDLATTLFNKAPQGAKSLIEEIYNYFGKIPLGELDTVLTSYRN